MSLERQAAVHLDAAIHAYELLGFVAPVLWAVGPGGSLTASPVTVEALEQSGQPVAATVLGSLAIATRATAIGRVDEAWVRVAPEDDPLDEMRPGVLAERADTDPRVRTAIICHALDLRSRRQVLGMAVAGLDDEGSPTWAFEWSPPVAGSRADVFATLAEALRPMRRLPPGDDSTAARIAEALAESGWYCLEA